jgi:hypothetical protein
MVDIVFPFRKMSTKPEPIVERYDVNGIARRHRMMVTRLVLSAAAAFVCVAATPTAARAQSMIAGVVTDASGAALHGVTVEVASDARTEQSRSVTTDGAGAYNVADLPAGTYTVTFTLLEYQTLKRDELRVATDATVNAALNDNRIRD